MYGTYVLPTSKATELEAGSFLSQPGKSPKQVLICFRSEPPRVKGWVFSVGGQY